MIGKLLGLALLISAAIAAAVVTVPTEAPAAPREIVSLPPPTVLPPAIQGGVRTQFLITTSLPASPQLIAPIVQVLKPNDKWGSFGRLRDDGTRGDAAAADGVFTLVRQFKPEPGALILRIRGREDHTTFHVSERLLLSEAGSLVVPEGLERVVPGSSALTNLSSTAFPDELPPRGGAEPPDVAWFGIGVKPKNASTTLDFFVQDFITTRDLISISSSSLVVAGKPAIRIVSSRGAPPREVAERHYVFVQRDSLSVGILSLSLNTSAPTYPNLLSQFDSLMRTFRVE